MKIAIVGSRGYTNLDDVRDYVRGLPPDTEVVSGGARGVDQTAEQTARACGLKTKIFPAQWGRYGKSAGFRRNADIVLYADHVEAFWDGVSKGTQHAIDMARKYKKSVIVRTG